MVSKTTVVDNDNQDEPRSSIKSETTTIVIADDDDDDICEAEHLRKLFIGGLSVETTDEKLRRFYSEWGQVVDSVVMRDSVTKRSRGFGFITYTKSSMVDAAQANRPHIIDGKKVESKRALPRPEQPATDVKKNISVKKLFVGGLKDNHDEECLKEHFSQFGTVVSVKILIDNTTGKRRGFAFIEYDDYDAVDKAILQKTHLIKYVLVDVRKSIYTQDDKKKIPEKDHGRNPDRNQVRDQGIRPVFRARVDQNNMPQSLHQRGYQGMNRQPPMPVPQQQYHQMPAYQQGPPTNYNQWGPPPQHPPQPPTPYAQPTPHPMQYQPPMPPHNYGGYQQPPIPPAQPPMQPGSWNGYAPAANNWNAPPPQAQVPSQPPHNNWQNNQWCAPPPIGGPPAPPMPPGNQPPPNWQQPPAPMPPGNPPPPNWQQPPVPQQPPPPPPLPNNFGNGYQQNYGGGPAKHPIMHTNRMNPYNTQPNQYNNHPAQGYGNPNGNKFRR